MTSKENAKVIRKEFRAAFPGSDVSVRIGTGTARCWVHADVLVPRSVDHDCPELTGTRCEACRQKENDARAKANSIISNLKSSGAIKFSQFYSDDGFGDPSDEFLLRVDVR